jgi:hypothetical protein
MRMTAALATAAEDIGDAELKAALDAALLGDAGGAGAGAGVGGGAGAPAGPNEASGSGAGAPAGPADVSGAGAGGGAVPHGAAAMLGRAVMGSAFKFGRLNCLLLCAALGFPYGLVVKNQRTIDHLVARWRALRAAPLGASVVPTAREEMRSGYGQSLRSAIFVPYESSDSDFDDFMRWGIEGYNSKANRTRRLKRKAQMMAARRAAVADFDDFMRWGIEGYNSKANRTRRLKRKAQMMAARRAAVAPVAARREAAAAAAEAAAGEVGALELGEAASGEAAPPAQRLRTE